MFNYGKASAKPLGNQGQSPFGLPRTESVHGWSKTHKSKTNYKFKSNYKSKSNYMTIFHI